MKKNCCLGIHNTIIHLGTHKKIHIPVKNVVFSKYFSLSSFSIAIFMVLASMEPFAVNPCIALNHMP